LALYKSLTYLLAYLKEQKLHNHLYGKKTLVDDAKKVLCNV